MVGRGVGRSEVEMEVVVMRVEGDVEEMIWEGEVEELVAVLVAVEVCDAVDMTVVVCLEDVG